VRGGQFRSDADADEVAVELLGLLDGLGIKLAAEHTAEDAAAAATGVPGTGLSCQSQHTASNGPGGIGDGRRRASSSPPARRHDLTLAATRCTAGSTSWACKPERLMLNGLCP